MLQDYLCRTNKSDDQNVYTSSVKNMKKKLRSLFSVGLTIVDYSDKGHYLKTELTRKIKKKGERKIGEN